MSWSNVKLIMTREVRDQLRDRRTLFVIAVLPVLLYPLIGMSFLQVAQFLKAHPTRIWLVGVGQLPATPPLIEDQEFHEDLVTQRDGARLMELTVDAQPPPGDARKAADRAVANAEFDAVVYFPPGFGERLARIVQGSEDAATRPSTAQAANLPDLPGPDIFFDRAKDKSRIARDRVDSVLTRWRARIVEQTLARSALPAAAAEPFRIVDQDVSKASVRQAAVWSKVLPFILIIWALTGAFYPAIDLCAGEKERGTLETLLSSPALRREIVWGKLLTIILFSMATALLNLISMGLTAAFIVNQLQAFDAAGGAEIGAPSLLTMGWLLVAIVPISGLFSALSLALAAMARSSKEGQYYLMPLLLGTLPLMMLPMLPAVELDLGNSLIPVTGMMLLLRSLMEGEYALALRFAAPVAGVTALCCGLAIRWAVNQFNDESVLFRESERFNLRLWLVHLVRDRAETPSAAAALLCGVLLLVSRFFAGLILPFPDTWARFAFSTLVVQFGLIAAPALLMTFLLSRRPRRTLLWRLPRLSAIPLSILLAICLQPAASAWAHAVHTLYPLSPSTLEQLAPIQQALSQAPSLLVVILLLALTPALCEELAFRGFILSGMRHLGNKWMAILVSSLFFGVAHTVLQQSLTAFALGMVIGYLAVQTGSLLPGILLHAVHNTVQLSVGLVADGPLVDHPALKQMVRIVEPGYVVYHWSLVLLSGLVAAGLLFWFHRLPFQPSPEEQLHRALDQRRRPAGMAV